MFVEKYVSKYTSKKCFASYMGDWWPCPSPTSKIRCQPKTKDILRSTLDYWLTRNIRVGWLGDELYWFVKKISGIKKTLKRPIKWSFDAEGMCHCHIDINVAWIEPSVYWLNWDYMRTTMTRFAFIKSLHSDI